MVDKIYMVKGVRSQIAISGIHNDHRSDKRRDSTSNRQNRKVLNPELEEQLLEDSTREEPQPNLGQNINVIA